MMYQDSLANIHCAHHNALMKQTASSDGAVRILYQRDMHDSEMIAYEVFPGIRLIYRFVHMEDCPMFHTGQGPFVEIHYCREGRLELRSGQDFLFLTPGSLAVVKTDQSSGSYGFPLAHYHGISIVIEESRISQNLSFFLEDIGLHPISFADRLCKGILHFSAGADEHIENLFLGLYSTPNSCRKGYLKIKVLELILALSEMEPETAKGAAAPLSPVQIELANQIADYLKEHVDQHITAEELSQRFHLSKTHLRNIFKSVYGIPVYSYIRIQKMQMAAAQLVCSSMTVLEIANACGYTNASKFAAAFREVMGETPVDYRNFHGSPQETM